VSENEEIFIWLLYVMFFNLLAF